MCLIRAGSQGSVQRELRSFSLSDIGISKDELTDICLIVRNLPTEHFLGPIGSIRKWFENQYPNLFPAFEKLAGFFNDQHPVFDFLPLTNEGVELGTQLCSKVGLTIAEWASLKKDLDKEILRRWTSTSAEEKAAKERVAAELGIEYIHRPLPLQSLRQPWQQRQ